MNIMKPNFEILTPISDGGIEELKHIERIGRVCYNPSLPLADAKRGLFLAPLSFCLCGFSSVYAACGILRKCTYIYGPT